MKSYKVADVYPEKRGDAGTLVIEGRAPSELKKGSAIVYKKVFSLVTEIPKWKDFDIDKPPANRFLAKVDNAIFTPGDEIKILEHSK